MRVLDDDPTPADDRVDPDLFDGEEPEPFDDGPWPNHRQITDADLPAWAVAEARACARWALAHGAPLDRDALRCILGTKADDGRYLDDDERDDWDPHLWESPSRTEGFVWSTVHNWCSPINRISPPRADHAVETLWTYLRFLDATDGFSPGSAPLASHQRALRLRYSLSRDGRFRHDDEQRPAGRALPTLVPPRSTWLDWTEGSGALEAWVADAPVERAQVGAVLDRVRVVLRLLRRVRRDGDRTWTDVVGDELERVLALPVLPVPRSSAKRKGLSAAGRRALDAAEVINREGPDLAAELRATTHRWGSRLQQDLDDLIGPACTPDGEELAQIADDLDLAGVGAGWWVTPDPALHGLTPIAALWTTDRHHVVFHLAASLADPYLPFTPERW